VIRNFSAAERRAVNDELEREKYDLIHAEAFYVMPHIGSTSVPTILVEQTIEYMVYKHYVDNEVKTFLKPFYYLDVIKLRYWEKHYWKKADQLVAVSPDDKQFMQERLPGIKVDIIPNGVDVKSYSSKKVKRKHPPRVMYGVTNFEWLQNVEAVDLLINKVWPKIHSEVSDARLWIVGRKIPQRIIDLAKQRVDVEATESIPDARDAYLASSVMVTPIKGAGGTRLKILEAMAAALPVVSTSVGVAGLNVTSGRNVLISDSEDGMAKYTIQVLRDNKLANKIGKNGQQFVKDHYDWTSIVKLHEPIYKNTLKKRIR
jgi:glycosyltransferase involved in cell wall biosynthesis